MREIEFRQAIYVDNKFRYWHYWGFLSDSEFIGLDTSRGIGHALKNSCQYTGLHDKNGKEIYEGDICEHLIGCSRDRFIEINRDIKLSLVVIEEQNAAWGFRALYPDLVHEDDKEWKPFFEDGEMWETTNFEIIGNIHEDKNNGKDNNQTN